MKVKENKGITLIVLIITIIIMLILVGVAIDLTIDSNLFDSAKKAVGDTNDEIEKTQTRVDELTDIMNEIGNIDYEKILAKYENVSGPIAIGPSGKEVDLSLWSYTWDDDTNGYGMYYEVYAGSVASGRYDGGYDGDIVDGKIIGEIPMYIKDADDDEFYEVTSLYRTFEGMTDLTIAPKIPATVTDMSQTFLRCTNLTTAPEIPNNVEDMCYTFGSCFNLTAAPKIPDSVTYMVDTFSGCTSLTTAPAIPSGVTDIQRTFSECYSLITAPKIPDSVTNMCYTFSGCTSLTTAPEIPSNVEYLVETFYGCNNLTGTLVINANPIDDAGALTDCATNPGCNLVLKGTSQKLNDLLATKSSNSNITIGQ